MIIETDENSWLRLNSSYPDGMFKHEWLDVDDEYPGMNVKEAAAQLGIHRATLSRVIHEHAPITLNPGVQSRQEMKSWN